MRDSRKRSLQSGLATHVGSPRRDAYAGCGGRTGPIIGRFHRFATRREGSESMRSPATVGMRQADPSLGHIPDRSRLLAWVTGHGRRQLVSPGCRGIVAATPARPWTPCVSAL